MAGRRWIVGADAWYVWVAKAPRNQIDGEMQEIFPFLEWHHTRWRWHLTRPWWMPWRRTLSDCLGRARALAAALTNADEEAERIEAHRHAVARHAIGDAVMTPSRLRPAWFRRIVALCAPRLVPRVRPVSPCEYIGGGPLDGHVEVLDAAVRVRVCHTVVPVAVSPWGEDARDPADQLCRVLVVGTYRRDGTLMRWVPA